ncbi:MULTISPECIES: hypothetical protein [Acinetobacter]|uniref:Uncharacterized protein n=1 Tax=Acinetobacter piscicola TaxID=2006115 RepID=A0A7S6VXX7_9GAMM|nr:MULTISPECIES: hypothetical protein [Acinetobacter]QOW46916.1 hypothetical protein G0028_14020 [Acinetobacter piscicola]
MNNQISAQIENRIDIEIQYVQHKNMEDNIRLYDQKGIYYLGLRAVEKAISKTEYQEILEMVQQDHFGKNLIVISEHYDWFWNKYFNFRDNDKLEKIGKSLFGKSWKKALAEALKVDERRITHWLQCTRPVPNGVWNDLKKVANQRKLEVENAIDLLTLSVDELTKQAAKKALN